MKAQRGNHILKIGVAILVSVAMHASSTYATVSLKNGNFSVGYTDIAFSGGGEPKIDRTFNSKSAFNGLFGFGWGSEYETYLRESADGSVVIHENGSGASNRFTTSGGAASQDVAAAVEMVLQAKVKEGVAKDATDAYRKRIQTDAQFRNSEYERFWSKGQLASKKIPEGTKLKSNQFGYQVLVKLANGYSRQFDSGKIEQFDDRGRLVKVTDRNRNWISLNYDREGRLATIQDNLNRKIQLKYNDKGKIASAQGDGGKSASYVFDGDLLVKSVDTDRNTYQYKYTGDGRYNLSEIKYSDNTTFQLGYYPASKGEQVQFQKDRDGTRTEYEYTGSPDTLNYATKVTIKGVDGKVLSQSRYEYTDKVKADGERYTSKLVAELDGDRTETIYNECCGLPVKITRNGEETSFEYDAAGHVVKKSTPYEVTELSYDQKFGKVARVSHTPTSKAQDGEKPNWAQYEYDDRGNLVSAKDSSSRGVKLVYDSNGRIKAMIDQDKRRLEFVYNEQSKPVKIIAPSVGQLDVTYLPSGEIKKVSSSGGRAIAMKVTSSFQNLLEIIRPAGVKLSFGND